MYRKEEPFKVAGYDINSIELYFMQPVENGTVNHDPESAKFYMAEYEIANNVDRVSVFDDLTGKLTNLYGDVFYEIEDGQVVRTWKDSEGNTVSLMRYGTEWENLDSITIIYMSATAMDDIQNLEKALYDEQYITDSNARQENADNYDGL